MNPILIHHLRFRSAKMPQYRHSLLTLGICLLIAAGFLPSCNTMQGVGQDVERTGEAIEGAAR